MLLNVRFFKHVPLLLPPDLLNIVEDIDDDKKQDGLKDLLDIVENIDDDKEENHQ